MLDSSHGFFQQERSFKNTEKAIVVRQQAAKGADSRWTETSRRSDGATMMAARARLLENVHLYAEPFPLVA